MKRAVLMLLITLQPEILNSAWNVVYEALKVILKFGISAEQVSLYIFLWLLLDFINFIVRESAGR